MPNLLLRSLQVLIVDDEPPNLIQLSELLAARPVNLFQARSGEQALKILASTPIDVVISDWMLPGISGLTLIQHLRASGFAGPLLIFTGMMLSAEHLQEALEAGASDYLRKPLNLIEFNARLDKSLELFAQRARLEAFNHSQYKLMELMTEHLGSEIQRLAQIQAIEDLGADIAAYRSQRMDSTRTLESRFRTLMNWSRYRFGLNQIELHRLEVRSLFKLVETHFGDQAARLRLKGGTAVCLVGNLDLLQRVLIQLVDNSLRYTSEDVILRCTARGSRLVLEVLDEGRLSEGELQRLAEDRSGGLGLRICHDLLALMGARLQAQKRSQGGSRFYFEMLSEL